MKSINFCILGDYTISDELGKKGNVTDITMYDRKISDKILNFIVPSSFPEKIQSLIQSISLSDFVIINVKKIDKDIGEIIVTLDNLKMDKGFIIPNGFDDEIKKFIDGTVLEKYEFLSLEELKEKILNIEPIFNEGNVKIIIDSVFEVKGVGTVTLGVVKRGVIKKHDSVEIFPEKETSIVKSLQMHDDDVDFVSAPGRVGLALRGTNSEKINKGSIIGMKDTIKIDNEIKIKFNKNKFYKEEINSESNYHICIGLQIKPVKIKLDNENLLIKSDKPLAYETNEYCLLIDLNSKTIRIVGSGKII